MLLSYVRTVILYLILIFVIRMMGKRQVGQMEPSEFVVTMLVANLASIPMQDGGIPLYSGLVPMLTILGVELVLSALSMYSIGLRRFLCGKPVILIDNGQILRQNLRRTRISLDELTGQLREKDVLDISTVQYAILETNGQISVFLFPKYRPASAKEAGIQAKKQSLPVTVIADGHLYAKNLPAAKKDMSWVNKVLKARKTNIRDTFLLTVDGQNRVIWLGKEDAK